MFTEVIVLQLVHYNLSASRQRSLSLPFLTYFFFNDPATTEIYTLSLHDALPISPSCCNRCSMPRCRVSRSHCGAERRRDRKSTRLNSSHPSISYAVFCLKKKKTPKSFDSTYPQNSE